MISLIVSGGIALALVGGIGLLLFDQPSPGDLGGVTLGGGLAIIMAAIAILPGRRMPDWAIGVRGDDLSRSVHAVPLVALGWAFVAAAIAGGTIESGIVEGAYAGLLAALAPLALARSLTGFLESARSFRAWGAARGFRYLPEADPGSATPLLRSGTYAYAVNCLRGELLGSRGALLCQLGLVTIEDSGGEVSSASTRRLTVLALPLADFSPRLEVLLCAPRSRVPGYDALKAFERRLKRIDLESSDFEARWELAIGKRDDQSWMRRLFEPSFTEALALAGPGWGWEVESGVLVVYEGGWRRRGDQLEPLVGRAEPIAERIRGEVAQSAGLG